MCATFEEGVLELVSHAVCANKWASQYYHSGQVNEQVMLRLQTRAIFTSTIQFKER